MNDSIKNACSILPARLKNEVMRISSTSAVNISEIRLRANQPLCITLGGKNMLLQRGGGLSVSKTVESIICAKDEIEQSFSAACEYSVYAYQNEIASGFITLKNGCRVGLAGECVIKNGKVENMKNIHSLSIRAAAEKINCAKKILRRLSEGPLGNAVIIGPPCSGKTTVLRDIARGAASGNLGELMKVCIIDERREIAANSGGISHYDLGLMTDVISDCPKHIGILNALRSLSPRLIIFDEISSVEELAACAAGFSAGANIITSAHASGAHGFLRRQIGRQMLESGLFDYYIFLGSNPGNIEKIMTEGELLENCGYHFNMHNSACGGSFKGGAHNAEFAANIATQAVLR